MPRTPVPPWAAPVLERALSRRRFLGAAAAGALGAGLLPTPAAAQPPLPNPEPLPIPLARPNPFGGPPIHFAGIGPADRGIESSTITDFNGFVGLTQIRGTGTGTNTLTGANEPLLFQADMSFMSGVYRGADGRARPGTFAFI